MMRKDKAPDGGPTSEQSAARVANTSTVHARGNEQPRIPLRYEDTKDRPDGLPLPVGMAPEAHGGHYYTPEDRQKYDLVAGYDKGTAPGYDPTKEALGGEDERGKYERKPWKSPRTGEEGTALVKRNFDGSRSIVAILAIDPSGNLVQLPPNVVDLKKGWRWASQQDCNEKTRQAEELNRKDEEHRKAAESAKPQPSPLAAPTLQSTESPEARKAREEADPALQAIRHGQSQTTAEKAAAPAVPPPDPDRGRK